LLFAVLVAEVIALTLRFDAGTLKNERHWWATLVLQAHFVPQIGSAVLIAILVFGGASWRDEVRRRLQERGVAHRPWLFLAGNLLAFLAFFQLTATVLEGSIRYSAHPEAWVLSWFALGALVLALWLGSLLPPSSWLPLAKHGFGVLIAGILLGLAVLEAGRWTMNWWEPLGRSTIWLVRLLLAGFFGETSYNPEEFQVGTGEFDVTIDRHCSGFEGIGLIWVFLLFFLWFFRREIRFPHALLLLPIGTAVMWLANVLRITALIALGTYYPDIAMAGFHSQAGWLSFNAVALGLLAAIRYFHFFSRPDQDRGAVVELNYSVPYLAPFFVLLAAVGITHAFSSGFDLWYPVRVLSVGAVLWFLRKRYAKFEFAFSWWGAALGAVAFLVWMALSMDSPAQMAAVSPWSEQAGLRRGGAEIWVFFRVLGSIVTVPVAEELAFRGFLTRQLIARDIRQVPLGKFSWFSFLVSSLLFGAFHESRWLPATLVGMLYALALYRRGRLGDAVWAHAVTNALIAAYVLATGSWALWST
jgi:exosortase E/protease (VPEID-CTERM system)